jgi:predicted O-methyltransferase YrrM
MAEDEGGKRTDELFTTRYRPGHFHSPLPSFREIDARADRIFERFPRRLPGIEMDVPAQLELLDAFSSSYLLDMPAYGMEPLPGLRFHHDNFYYSCRDAAILHCMVRHLRPRRIVEVGSGFSSCMLLDTNELFFDRHIDLTFIEPHPERLYENIHEKDRETVRVVDSSVQDVDPETFAELASGDMLFIDSSHVTKIGSDVNHLLFDVLPSLERGVFVHFHDIFYPFEYLRDWVDEGRAWNEAYALRAFLQYNSAFAIRFFTSYLLRFFPERFEGEGWLKIPKRGSRSSLWLQKVAG